MDPNIPRSAARILDFIGDTEAPRGYDTVFGNNRMPSPLTSMTLDEVIADGPRRTKSYRSSACGRYQFMTDTLKGLKKELHLSGGERFTPDLQDHLAMRLLKRRGWDKFEAGEIGLSVFAKNLAMEWASLPVLKDTAGAHRRIKRGQSYYAGDGLNHALVRPEEIEKLLAIPVPAQTVDNATTAAPTTPVTAKPPAQSLLARLGTAFGILPKPAAKPPIAPVDPADRSTVVMRVQKQLQALGYVEVGLADGIAGPKLRAAVDAFCAEQTPPIKSNGEITDEFLAALPKAKVRAVSAERANATVKDLQAAGNKPAQAFGTLGWLGGLMGGGSLLSEMGAGQLVDSLKSTSDKASDTLTSLQSGISTIASVVDWLGVHWRILVMLAGFWVAMKALRGALELRALYRAGKLQQPA